ncbi:MAG: GYF domain-containing protein [Gemmataceae bacterium]|nr:GYF domain-containing protein [Gemmataceae bacterium]MDW8243571.1 GYF domain-containing protein [Thermogemmata sp.]
MNSRWFITRDGKHTHGPFTEEQLLHWAQSGKLLPTDLVWKEGSDSWVPLSSVFTSVFSYRPAPGSPSIGQSVNPQSSIPLTSSPPVTSTGFSQGFTTTQDKPAHPPPHLCHSCGASVSLSAEFCPNCHTKVAHTTANDQPLTQPIPHSSHRDNISSTRLAAGLLGILLGGLGIHKFVLGLTTPGLIMLLVTLLTCGAGGLIMAIIGLIEGIIYLTKTDDEFYQTYMIRKKEWF